jgi:hypothetical protein
MQGDFLVKFENKNPVSAQDIGLLLREISGAYREKTGSKLVLRKYELGSTWIYFADAAAAAATIAGHVGDISSGAKNTLDFAKYLGGLLAPEENTSGSVKAMKAAKRIAKIAADNDADVELSYLSDGQTGSETFEMKLTSSQSKAKLKSLSRGSSDVVENNVRASKHTTAPEFEDIFKRLTSEADSNGDLLNIVVSLLQESGNDQLLISLAEQLESAGRYNSAEIVREHIRGSGRGSQQLLT